NCAHFQFNRASIIGAIVKVVLKSFIESIRLQTYGKFAVEQIQVNVDCYYLQRGVSPLVADEVVVNSMVDQALSSALKRCVSPELIHPSRLRQICDDKKTNKMLSQKVYRGRLSLGKGGVAGRINRRKSSKNTSQFLNVDEDDDDYYWDNGGDAVCNFFFVLIGPRVDYSVAVVII
ncbi:unnamed protein product, partial [Strongylus vulgaris]